MALQTFSSIQFNRSVLPNSVGSHGLQYATLPCPSPTLGTCSNPCPLSRWFPPTISSSVVLFSCLQSLPASGSFPMSHFFSTGSQSIGASSTPTILMFWISSWITWWLPLGATSRKGLISKGVLLLHGEIGIKG